jgi:alpha-D-ribose 1-methylphosphonate 5-triphosphate synthase subunit PhnH
MHEARMNTHSTEQYAIQPWQPLAQQAAFRHLLEAFSYPGRVVCLGTASDDTQTMLLATLVDAGVTLADPHNQVSADDRRRLDAQLVLPDRARFVVSQGAHVPDYQPVLGTLESPEQGATVIVCVESLGEGARLDLTGPGIDGETTLHVAGMDPGWWIQRSRWNASFPMGVDLILVAGRRLAALPRTTRIQVQGAH